MVDQLDDSKALMKVVRSVAMTVYSTVDWMDDSRVEGLAQSSDDQMAAM
jgi:hypothetical protein